MFLMPFFWLLILIGIIAVIAGAVQGGSGVSASSPRETALDILSKRYARGEIGKEEFEEKRKGLGGK